MLLHIILGEIPWLHAAGWPEERDVPLTRLSPRERMVLNLMLDGKSRQEMANVLGLSVHTVGEYVKSVYQFFRVGSHAGLMTKFLDGPVIPDLDP
jgi:DNA-binding CsgD family transcriptional regulator